LSYAPVFRRAAGLSTEACFQRIPRHAAAGGLDSPRGDAATNKDKHTTKPASDKATARPVAPPSEKGATGRPFVLGVPVRCSARTVGPRLADPRRVSRADDVNAGGMGGRLCTGTCSPVLSEPPIPMLVLHTGVDDTTRWPQLPHARPPVWQPVT